MKDVTRLRLIPERERFRRPDQRKPRVAGERRVELFDPRPLARLRHDGLGAIAARPEIEHLDVVPVHRQRARAGRRMAREVREIFVERRLVVRVTLELLERDRLVPDQRDRLAVVTRRDLREVAPFRIPFGMRPRRVVPLHDERLIPRVEVVLDQAGGVRLLVDERQPRPEAEEPLVDLVADAQVRRVHRRGHQRPDDLRVPAADELALAARDEDAQRVEPRRIDRRRGLEREPCRLDTDRGARPLRQTQQRPVAAPHDVGALRLLDRGVRQVQVKDREELQHVTSCESDHSRPQRRPTAPDRPLPHASRPW